MPYEKDGIKYPRCTQIISDCTDKAGALTQWAANMVVEWIQENGTKLINPKRYYVNDAQLNEARFNFRDVSKKALDIGSEVHNAIEMHLQDKGFVLTTNEAKQAFSAFVEWMKEVNLKPISLEQTVWGENFAGTCDFYGYYKGKLFIIDWKTSKKPKRKKGYPEWAYQISAYRSCIGDCEGMGILRLDKVSGLPEFYDLSDEYKNGLKVFKCMVELYMLKHPIIARRFKSNAS